MGLEKEITDGHGTTHAAAYFKVQAPRIDHTAKVAKFGVVAWKDKAARDSGLQPLDSPLRPHFIVKNIPEGDQNFDTYFLDSVLKTAGKSPVSQAYAFAKTHADYSDADDVLE